MMGEMRRDFGDDRREAINEYKNKREEIRKDFREEMSARREYMMGSGTPGIATPTPWRNLKEGMRDARKDLKEDMKDAKGEMKERMQNMRDDMKSMMRPRMATLTATQTAAIAAKLGISLETLNAQLASGTKLKEIIQDKIKPEEMKLIIPPRVSSITKAIEERGFFNNFRSRLLGPRQEVVEQTTNEYGEVIEQTKPVPAPGLFRRFFNWQ
jgi:hypothetical protein